MVGIDGVVKKNDTAIVAFSTWELYVDYNPMKGTRVVRYVKATKLKKDIVEDIKQILENVSPEKFTEVEDLDMGGITLKDILGADNLGSAVPHMKRVADGIFEYRPYYPEQGEWSNGKIEIRELKLKDLEGFENVSGEEIWK